MVAEPLSGYLLHWSSGESLRREHLLACPNIRFVRKWPDTEWDVLTFSSPRPLVPQGVQASGPFVYTLHCRRSGNKMVLLSINKRIVDVLLASYLKRYFEPRLRKVQIRVPELVRSLVDEPSKYVLTFVHAKTPGFGKTLRTASLYGDDLAGAFFFRDNLEYMKSFSCGLGASSSIGREILRLGSDGSLSFYLRSATRAVEVERALGFVTKSGFSQVQWESEHGEHATSG